MDASNIRTRVLIVEDEFYIGKMVQILLEEVGYAVVGTATTGVEAIEKVATLRPDVIIMDIQMPDMDGIEAARRIQALYPTPIVVLSAYESRALINEASEAGVGAYLVKPSEASELARSITVAMARFDDTLRLRAQNEALARRQRQLEDALSSADSDADTDISAPDERDASTPEPPPRGTR